MLHGGDHILQLVVAGVEDRVGHAGVDLVFKVLTLAVAGGGNAQTQGAQRVADAGLEDAAVDLDHVARRRALVVEGVARHVLGAERALVHRDQVGADALAHVILAQGAVLDEHIHLNAVTEGLVRDQTGDLGRGDDLVFARLDPPGGKQVADHRHAALQLGVKLRKELRAAETGNALVAVLDGAVLAAYDRNDHALGIDVALAQVAVLGQKQLADVGGLGSGDGLDHPLVQLHPVIGEGGQTVHQGLDVGGFGELLGLALHEKGQRLVGQGGSVIDLRAAAVENCLLGGELRLDPRSGLLRAVRVKFVERILAVLAAAVETDDDAALGGHRFGADGAGPAGDGDRQTDGVRRQDAHVVPVPAQQSDQLFQTGLDLKQIWGKRCFHGIPPCP